MTAAIALAYLDDAVIAAARLRGKTHPDALHDFRVAIRRLRVTIRSSPELRDTVSKKQRRRLRKLARATNRARDAEVQIAWFNDHAARLSREQRAAVSRLRARFRARRRTELARIRARLDGSFANLEHKLRRRLVGLRNDPLVSPTPFPALVIATVTRLASDLDARLKTIGRSLSSSPRAMHAARIAAKRLRYTLEPVQDLVPGGAATVDRLKQLQDRFGALTDAHALGEVLRGDQEAWAAVADILEAETAEATAALRRCLPPEPSGWPAPSPSGAPVRRSRRGATRASALSRSAGAPEQTAGGPPAPPPALSRGQSYAAPSATAAELLPRAE